MFFADGSIQIPFFETFAEAHHPFFHLFCGRPRRAKACLPGKLSFSDCPIKGMPATDAITHGECNNGLLIYTYRGKIGLSIFPQEFSDPFVRDVN